jgi:transposase
MGKMTQPISGRATKLVNDLINTAGLTPQKIAEEMGNRVSSRTIYRWAKGEHTPQQRTDIDELEKVAKKYSSEIEPAL